MESKADKFVRIKDMRLPKIIHALNLLENLSQNTYESTVEQREKLIAQLTGAVDDVAKALGVTSASADMMLDAPISQALSNPIVSVEELTKSLETQNSPTRVPAAGTSHPMDGIAAGVLVTEPDYSDCSQTIVREDDCPVCKMRESTPTPAVSRPVQPIETADGDIGPGFIAEGGASAFSEISWAYDTIGKDNKLARNRLKRVIDFWKKN